MTFSMPLITSNMTRAVTEPSHARPKRSQTPASVSCVIERGSSDSSTAAFTSHVCAINTAERLCRLRVFFQ